MASREQHIEPGPDHRRPRLGGDLIVVALLAASGLVAAEPTYRLPFPKAASYPVRQSFDGRYGHSEAATFAVDFDMPIGTPVAAARGGSVVAVVEEHPNAEPRKPQPGNENYVVVDHGDQTFGRYYHLDQYGAEVVMGETVVAGQRIGRSGNSGATFGPHLHFDVTGACFEWGCQTVRFRFSGVEDDPLLEGETYGGTRGRPP